jgi:hypothetical protein
LNSVNRKNKAQRCRNAKILEERKDNMDYLCTGKDCTFGGKTPYTLHIPLEVWERNNTAVPFCPHCGSTLKEKTEKREEVA